MSPSLSKLQGFPFSYPGRKFPVPFERMAPGWGCGFAGRGGAGPGVRGAGASAFLRESAGEKPG